MTTRTRIGLAALLALLAALLWMRSSQPLDGGIPEKQPPSAAPEVAAQPIIPPSPASGAPAPAVPQDKPLGPPLENVALFKAFFAQAVSIHGRVIDQGGHAIPGVHVQLTVHDKPGEEGSEYAKTTNNEGRFEISGVNGASVNVEVSKDGYYRGRESRRVFDAGQKNNADNPAVFVLHKKGEGVPLVYLRSATIGLKEEGGVAYIDFKRGRITSANAQGQLRIEIMSSPGLQRGRAWGYKIVVPGGGLQKRTHEFAFSAPVSGYVETIEGGYGGNTTDDPNWRGSFGDQFFAQLPDGSVARFQVNLGIKGGSYAEISQLVYNPDPNSRNLEYDPEKTISTGR